MAQSDFEAAIADVESGAGASKDVDFQTLFSQLTGAIDVRIGLADDASPAQRKLRAFRQRSVGLENENKDSGAGLSQKQFNP